MSERKLSKREKKIMRGQVEWVSKARKRNDEDREIDEQFLHVERQDCKCARYGIEYRVTF